MNIYSITPYLILFAYSIMLYAIFENQIKYIYNKVYAPILGVKL